MTGSPILANLCFIKALACQAALSRRMVLVSCQPGSSWSSCRTKCLKNVVITSASVFACVKAHHIRPSVSRATSKEILGATYRSEKVAGESVGTHCRLMKRVPLSQLSSTFIIRRPDSNRGIILKANYYRSTKQRSLLL